MTIYDIKYRTQETSPYFFSRNTLKFFGQTMKSFKVYKQYDGRFMLCAPFGPSKPKGETMRYFNPANNELERS